MYCISTVIFLFDILSVNEQIFNDQISTTSIIKFSIYRGSTYFFFLLRASFASLIQITSTPN